MVQLRNRYIPSPDVRSGRRNRRNLRRPSPWKWLTDIGFQALPALGAYASSQKWFGDKSSNTPAPVPAPGPQKVKRPKQVKFVLPQVSSKMGHDAQRIIRGGKRLKATDPYRASIKIEKGIAVNGLNAVYVGGCTHPCQATVLQVFQALIRFFFIREKVDFPTFDAVIGEGLNMVYNIDFWHRYETRSSSAMTKSSISSTIGQTYSAFTETVVDKFIEIFGTVDITAGPPSRGSPSQRLVYIAFTGSMLGNNTFVRLYKAEELFVTVKGESSIQVQNRTKADVAGTEDTSTESIYANPLRGKYYRFERTGRVSLKAPGQVAAGKYSYFPYDQNCGLIRTQDQTAVGTSSFTDQVYQALKKPPTGNMFTNCSTTKYITCKPGEIIRSHVQSVVTKSLTNWMFAFHEKWFQQTTKTYDDMVTQEDPPSWRIGATHMYGLEKMVDTNAESVATPVTVGIEHNLFVVGRCEWKPRMGSLAQVNIVT